MQHTNLAAALTSSNASRLGISASANAQAFSILVHDTPMRTLSTPSEVGENAKRTPAGFCWPMLLLKLCVTFV